MKYMGSKNRYKKDLLPILLKDRKPGQYYVEPFCGSCSIICEVEPPCIANDNHYYLISMWKALQKGWIPPAFVSNEQYDYVRQFKELYFDPCLVGYVGFNSYGGKWFGGYPRDKANKRDYWDEYYRNIMKQVPKLKDIIFICGDYTQMDIPPNSIIYADPPYENTTKYKGKFDHIKFWDWCRQQQLEHQVYISEYNTPDDFECIWSKQVNNTLVQHTGSKQGIEKLWRYHVDG